MKLPFSKKTKNIILYCVHIVSTVISLFLVQFNELQSNKWIMYIIAFLNVFSLVFKSSIKDDEKVDEDKENERIDIIVNSDFKNDNKHIIDDRKISL